MHTYKITSRSIEFVVLVNTSEHVWTSRSPGHASKFALSTGENCNTVRQAQKAQYIDHSSKIKRIALMGSDHSRLMYWP
jgi:hypothetical protein